MRLAFEECEVLVAAEVERRFRQLRLRLELGVNPNVVAQVEGLVADLLRARLYLQRVVFAVNAHGLLLRALALALLDGHRAGRRLRGLLRRGRWTIARDHAAADAAESAVDSSVARRGVLAPRVRRDAQRLRRFRLDGEVGGVGRDDAVARAEVNYLVGQLLLLAVRAYLLHQPADAPRRPESRQEVVALLRHGEVNALVCERARGSARAPC